MEVASRPRFHANANAASHPRNANPSITPEIRL